MPWLRKGKTEYWHEPKCKPKKDSYTAMMQKVRARCLRDSLKRTKSANGNLRGAVDCICCDSEIEYVIFACGAFRARCMSRKCVGIS